MENLTSLEHHFLIAMPNLADSWFEKTLVYVVEDNQHGTMGLVVNLPHKFNLTQLLEHFQLPTEQLEANETLSEQVIMMGGPVDMEHGFILHQPPGDWQKSVSLADNLAMTVSEDFLKSISEGKLPEKMLVCLGFAGWEKGQLNEEIQQNNWLTIPYNESLLFDIDPDQKWQVALNTLGILPESLSMEAGHG
ncbi:YqgE/AlgH family protein [Hydrogenovibrio sp. SC-1]|uniref:YqgE/AlgH family protein n=1 Tax=Hydrogenovibrio sp. SC-1 TaxID=2065820 RepID=UPI000C7AC737|nr:YqgE/AlgH family protein [Hydrogenovibrio sp. SC-1]PLA74841.1 YqgE/AlgH family protein [Hydrogenovibrio sp. SC-1]